MKIVFLSHTYRALGGVTTVNNTLSSEFIRRGDEVSLVFLRNSCAPEAVSYPQGANIVVINPNAVWERPLYSDALSQLRSRKIISAFKTVAARFSFNRSTQADYKSCMKQLLDIMPDIIIVSHYEMLSAVPESLLSRTVCHFHSSFSLVENVRNCKKFMLSYADRIYSFLWLSKASYNLAIKNGFKNSCYIYNPISFSCNVKTDITSKNIVFLGRFSESKRLDLTVDIFTTVIEQHGITDWRLNIYGSGELSPELERAINECPYISFKGISHNPMNALLGNSIFIMTSGYEGMALTLLEAYECGIPVIAYDFGETVYEEILPDETGIIITQGDKEMFVKQLHRLMTDTPLRITMGENAKQFASNFKVSAVANNWYTLFNSIKNSMENSND